MCAYIIYYISFFYNEVFFRKAACHPLNLKRSSKTYQSFFSIKFFSKINPSFFYC